MRSLASPRDGRPEANPGESRNAHFADSADKHRDTVANMLRGRRADILEYGGDEYDE